MSSKALGDERPLGLTGAKHSPFFAFRFRKVDLPSANPKRPGNGCWTPSALNDLPCRSVVVAEGVIMKIGGWKTPSVFERYAIVSQSDIRDAMSKLEAGQQRDNAKAAREKKATEDQFGQGLGRIALKDADLNTSSLRTSPPVN